MKSTKLSIKSHKIVLFRSFTFCYLCLRHPIHQFLIFVKDDFESLDIRPRRAAKWKFDESKKLEDIRLPKKPACMRFELGNQSLIWFLREIFTKENNLYRNTLKERKSCIHATITSKICFRPVSRWSNSEYYMYCT